MLIAEARKKKKKKKTNISMSTVAISVWFFFCAWGQIKRVLKHLSIVYISLLLSRSGNWIEILVQLVF